MDDQLWQDRTGSNETVKAAVAAGAMIWALAKATDSKIPVSGLGIDEEGRRYVTIEQNRHYQPGRMSALLKYCGWESWERIEILSLMHKAEGRKSGQIRIYTAPLLDDPETSLSTAQLVMARHHLTTLGTIGLGLFGVGMGIEGAMFLNSSRSLPQGDLKEAFEELGKVQLLEGGLISGSAAYAKGSQALRISTETVRQAVGNKNLKYFTSCTNLTQAVYKQATGQKMRGGREI